jgi:hypothetical protein
VIRMSLWTRPVEEIFLRIVRKVPCAKSRVVFKIAGIWVAGRKTPVEERISMTDFDPILVIQDRARVS